MPIETVEESTPPPFRRGQGPLARLALLSALALFLMVADARFHALQPLRAAVATVLYPAQWLALQPVQWGRSALGYFTELKTLQTERDVARRTLVAQAQRAGQVEQLLLENNRLRALLQLKERLPVPSQAAQVLYDATDPYGRRVVIDKGQLQGIQVGSPVMDEAGVLGQVTRVYPLMSEVTLLTDGDQVTPVVNTRTGVRTIVYGHYAQGHSGLELRYVVADDDLRAGDLLATSGLDGVYPPGLPVAVVDAAPTESSSGTTTVACTPIAHVHGARFVMVLTPRDDEPAAEAAAAAGAPAEVPAPASRKGTAGKPAASDAKHAP